MNNLTKVLINFSSKIDLLDFNNRSRNCIRMRYSTKICHIIWLISFFFEQAYWKDDFDFNKSTNKYLNIYFSTSTIKLVLCDLFFVHLLLIQELTLEVLNRNIYSFWDEINTICNKYVYLNIETPFKLSGAVTRICWASTSKQGLDQDYTPNSSPIDCISTCGRYSNISWISDGSNGKNGSPNGINRLNSERFSIF